MNSFSLTFKEVDCEQGSPEWFDARAGVITGSMVSTIRSRLKNGQWSNPAKKYAFRLAFERVAKSVLDDTYSNSYMKRGNFLENDARVLHEIEAGDLIIVPGFFVSECGRFGASPDGLIGSAGGAEYKCFLSPDELMPILIDGDTSTVTDQIQINMLATGRKWWDFFLYTPQISTVTEKPYKIFRIPRDEEYISEMLKDLFEFNALIEVYAEQVKAAYGICADQQKEEQPELSFNFDFEV